MELITILLSGLLGLLAPIGLISDRLVASAIRDRLDSAETLAVRIDNAPSYQLLQGKVQRVRIAGRGIVPQPDLRIAVLELETDAIALNPASIRQGKPQLEEPLQAGVRAEVTETDVNRFLQSAAIEERLKKMNFNLPGSDSQQAEPYNVKKVQVDFLDRNRLKLWATLQGKRSGTETIITAESGFAITSGRQLQLVDPQVMFGETAVPAEIIMLLTTGLLQQLDLARLENSGLTSRVLNFQIQDNQLDLAAFVRVEPKFLTRL
jgi:LmeA-like phospholipid-binding